MPELLLLFGLLLVVLAGIAIATVLRPGFDDDLGMALERLAETIQRRAGMRGHSAEKNSPGPHADEIRRRLGLDAEAPAVESAAGGVPGSPAAPPTMRAGRDTLIAVAAPTLEVERGEPVFSEPTHVDDRALAAAPAEAAAAEQAAAEQAAAELAAAEQAAAAEAAAAEQAAAEAAAAEQATAELAAAEQAAAAEAAAAEQAAAELAAAEQATAELAAAEQAAAAEAAAAEQAAAELAAAEAAAAEAAAAEQAAAEQAAAEAAAAEQAAAEQAAAVAAAIVPAAPPPHPDSLPATATGAAGLIGLVAKARRTIASRLFGGRESSEPVSEAKPSAGTASSPARADAELEETRPSAVYRQILRGNRAALETVAASLAGGDSAIEAHWHRLLDRLFSSIQALALDAGYLDPPRALPFWAAFGPEQGRDVMQALASLGYRFDGRGGWLDDRPPTRRDLSVAVGYAGVDPVRMRTWPSPDELGALAGQVTIAGAEYLEVVAPGLTLAEVSAAVEPLDAAGELGEVWREWDRIRSLLLAEG